MGSAKEKRLFKNFGIWPTTSVLAFFTPAEIIDISRVNKEAHYISKKVYGMRKVALERINIRSVKFFKRAEKINISKDSLGFFQQYKDNFFEEILGHYRNVTKMTINLNFLFEERKKDQLFDKLSQFELKPHIATL